MIKNLVVRDVKSRYMGSVLGVLWTFMDPLLQIIVYSIVFSFIMKSGIEYFYLFLCVGLIPWIFFTTSFTGCTYIIIGQQDMVKKVFFPRSALIVSFVLSNFVNLVLSFIVVFGAIIVSGMGINPSALLLLPVVMLLEFLFALGVALIGSSVTVYFRDLRHIFDAVALAWMYVTPVIYPEEWVPERLRTLLYLNPMSAIIISYRDILYYKRLPSLNMMLIAVLSSVIVLVIGFVVFQKLQRGFIEEL